MNIQNLTTIELSEINGGTEQYDAGYNAGTHVRDSIIAIGDVISWAFDLVF